MLGPLIGGFVLDAHLKPRTPYALLAVCPLVFAAAAIAMGLVARRRDPPADAVPQPAPAQ